MYIQKKWQRISGEMLLAVVLMFGFTQTVSAAPELPVFDATNFSNPTVIDNPWLSLPVGREFEYEGETEDGFEVIEIEITGDTYEVMGIETLVYRDLVWIDGELVEDTRDYLAQDDDGNETEQMSRRSTQMLILLWSYIA